MYYNIHQHLMETFPTVQKNAGPDYPYHYPASRLSLDYLMQLLIQGYLWLGCLRCNMYKIVFVKTINKPIECKLCESVHNTPCLSSTNITGDVMVSFIKQLFNII